MDGYSKIKIPVPPIDVQKQIVDAMKLNQSTLPVFIIADTFNRVVFVSQGYTIGLGEQLMKVVHGL